MVQIFNRSYFLIKTRNERVTMSRKTGIVRLMRKMYIFFRFFTCQYVTQGGPKGIYACSWVLWVVAHPHTRATF